jgi:hypothetical protein
VLPDRRRSPLIYLHLDSDREVSPFVTDKAGKPLAKNRQDPRAPAMSKAINRPAIVEKVMEGEAIASASWSRLPVRARRT